MSGPTDVTAKIVRPVTPCVLDVFYGDWPGTGDVDKRLAAVKADGVAAIFAKATQGKDYVDPRFHDWFHAVTAAGIEFGAYHFSSNTEGGDLQAGWFLDHVDGIGCDVANTGLMLDFERNPNKALTVTAPIGRAFAYETKKTAGFYPFLYGDVSFLSQLTDPNDELGHCPLWVAQYGGTNPHVPPAWSTKGWTLWQYSDGKYAASVGPRETPGFPRMDRSVFHGTADDLRAAWPSFGG